MSFTVLRVEVQQWKDEGISLPVGGQSEEGVEADEVVEDERHHEECGQLVMRIIELAMFMFIGIRAEIDRILDALLSTIKRRLVVIIFPTVRGWLTVELDHQVDVGDNVRCG